MTDLFAPPIQPRLSIVGRTELFPIHRIFCVGRNYAAHAAEMGHDIVREAPFYFTKSHHAVETGLALPYAPGTDSYHFEFEFAIALGEPGHRVSQEAAPGLIFGYLCALDMTRRDLQSAAKKKSLPWDTAKDVEGSCALSAITPSEAFTPSDQSITLRQDGEIRQSAQLSDMIWSVPEIIAHLSTLYHLRPGDIILTGTPAGVGPVLPGQELLGEITGLAPLKVTVNDA
ncbi:MAG: fumarylacetoacetate hydrolase family protein [Pseudomonadota bacterium]